MSYLEDLHVGELYQCRADIMVRCMRTAVMTTMNTGDTALLVDCWVGDDGYSNDIRLAMLIGETVYRLHYDNSEVFSTYWEQANA